MKDRPSDDARHWLFGPGQAIPADSERATAWQREFSSGGAFRSAFEHASIGMAIVDLDGRFLKVNRSLCEIVGYRENELLARTFQDITHPDDLEADLMMARRLVAGDIDVQHLEKRYVHSDGHAVWIELSGSIVRDEQGRPCYAVAQIQDVSARKEAERQSAHRLRQMELLSHAVPRVLQAFEIDDDDECDTAVLRAILEAFASPTGLLLRINNSLLSGMFVNEVGASRVTCTSENLDEAWNNAPDTACVLVENKPRAMGCGRTVARSLVGPIVHDGRPVGLVHIGDCPVDYQVEDADLLAGVSKLIAPLLHARIQRDKLTVREAEVMDLIVAGQTQKQIAAQLGISVQTAAKHRARILGKLDMRSDIELARLAMRMRPPGQIL